MARAARTMRGRRHDDGAVVIEVVLLAPALILIILVSIAAMRIEVAGEAVDASAHDAARAASISRNGPDAKVAGRNAARQTLRADGLNCSHLSVAVDTSQFSVPIGQPATVRATVTCVVDLSDLAIPGLPGSRTLTSAFTSPIDQYGGRS
jgi:Flp pilus assembly protein TadG